MDYTFIISTERIKDKVIIENQEFSAYISIGVASTTDFYVKLEFFDLNMTTLPIAAKLCQLPHRLKITSDVIQKEGYNITHIVVTNIHTDSTLAMTWDCLSDDPANYE